MFRTLVSYSSRKCSRNSTENIPQGLIGETQIPYRGILAGDFAEFLDVNHWQLE